MDVSELTRSHAHQRGSALLFLFVAIALFGALSWAMLGNSRGSLSLIEAEIPKTDATAQGDCANAVNLGLKRLTARGCPSISLRLDGASTDTPDGSCSVYTPNGGGVKACRAESVAGFCPANLYDLPLGAECGGLVYIGTFAGHRSYAATTDAGKITWNNGTSGAFSTGATSTNDGKANTDTLVSFSGGQQPYKAAIMCRSLGPEWYLPSVNELKAIVNLAGLIPTLATGNGTWDKSYWSSTDKDTIRACGLRVQDGGTCGGWSRNLNLNIRCVRR